MTVLRTARQSILAIEIRNLHPGEGGHILCEPSFSVSARPVSP